MKFSYLNWIALLCLMFCCLNLKSQCPTPIHPDINALIDIYNDLNGSNWNSNNGWVDGVAGNSCDPCTDNWDFITCENNRVVDISFPFVNSITGVFPVNGLENLSELKKFVISFANVSGTLPDDFLVNSTTLEEFSIGGVSVTGPIPSSFGTIPSLRRLEINNTLITGVIPEFATNSNIDYLRLENNNLLTGVIPNSIGNLTNLETLFIRDNNILSGSIPESLGTLTQIEHIDLSNCDLTGQIPFSFGAHNVNLTKLKLSANNLDGVLPEGIGYIPNLQSIFLNNNNIEGCFPNSYLNLNSPLPINPFIRFDFNNLNTTYVNFYTGASPGCPNESCDGLDNNNNGLIDEGVGTPWFIDNDGDGFGSILNTQIACAQPLGYVSNTLDCDDFNANVYLGNTEICDGVDNNCDGLIDEGLTISTWYLDNDGDGFGDDGNTLSDCQAPSEYVLTGGDCDDNNASVYPSAPDFCDGIDNNCDGVIDEGFFLGPYYEDLDGDGFGNENSTPFYGCAPPAGYTVFTGDCSDLSPFIYPGAPEFCDGVDQDCDGVADNGFDMDGDGVADCFDNCPNTPNPNQEDSNGNGVGDVCDIIGDCENIPDNSTEFEYIDRVQSVGFDNQSGDDGGYADYTSFQAIVYQDANTPFFLTPGYNGASYPENWTIWVDWNQDNDFDDANELVFQTNNSQFGTVQANVQAPAGTGGQYVMRIQMGYFTPSSDPCETTGGEGETEDYSIYVLPCYSNGGTTNYEYIDEVSFAGQTSTTGNNNGWYFDVDNPFTMDVNQSIPVSLVPGFNGPAYNEYWRVWIDINFDGQYTNDEIVFEENGTGSVTGNINFPAGQALGLTSMKIAMKWNSFQGNPCNGYLYGEVEDYLVHLVQTQSLSANDVISLMPYTTKDVAPLASQSEIENRLRADGISEASFDISAFPNPSANIFMITFSGDFGSSANYQLFDTSGRLVLDGSTQEDRFEIDLANYASGNYILKVFNDNGIKHLSLAKR